MNVHVEDPGPSSDGEAAGPRRLLILDPVSALRPSPVVLRLLRLLEICTIADLLLLNGRTLRKVTLDRLRTALLDLRKEAREALQQGRITVDPESSWEGVLAALPARIGNALRGLGLRTLNDVAQAVNTGLLRNRPNFARGSRLALREALATLALERPVPGEPAPPGDEGPVPSLASRLAGRGIDLGQPWQEVLRGPLPRRARSALDEFGGRSLGEVIAAVESGALLSRWNFGRVSQRALIRALVTIARDGVCRHSMGVAVAPRSVVELIDAALAYPELREADRQLLVQRLLEGQSLTGLGQARHVTRERIRQRLAALLGRLGRSFGPAARGLLGEVIAATREAGGLIHRDRAAALAGEPEPRRLLFGLRLAEETSFTLYHGEFLSTLRCAELDGRLQRFRKHLWQRGGPAMPLSRAQQLAAELCGLHLAPADLRILCTSLLKLRVEDDHLILRRPFVRERLAELLFSAGRPLHLTELIQALARSSQGEGERHAHNIESVLRRSPIAYRCGERTFVHRAWLPISPEQEATAAAFCAERLKRRRGPVRVSSLLGELGAAGIEVPGLNVQILRDALIRLPGVVPAGRYRVDRARGRT